MRYGTHVPARVNVGSHSAWSTQLSPYIVNWPASDRPLLRSTLRGALPVLEFQLLVFHRNLTTMHEGPQCRQTVDRSRAREVATQKPCLTSGWTGYRGDMSFDRRPLWNHDRRAGVNRLNQLCCNGLARLVMRRPFASLHRRSLPAPTTSALWG